jgi:sugar transferase EpsL
MKRLLDLCVASAGLLLLAPVLLVVAILVRLRLGSPVLFRQMRPGRHGLPFELLKFRTMRDLRDPEGRPLADGDRLTPLGRRMRALSLDELPQLLNVLMGDMSLVGPRPLLMHYLERYTPDQARRNEVLPGITGWTQVNGRNSLSWEEKFRLDTWYVCHRSLLLDLRILGLTAWKVVRRDGIHAANEATMSEFMGSPLPDLPGDAAR